MKPDKHLKWTLWYLDNRVASFHQCHSRFFCSSESLITRTVNICNQVCQNPTIGCIHPVMAGCPLCSCATVIRDFMSHYTNMIPIQNVYTCWVKTGIVEMGREMSLIENRKMFNIFYYSFIMYSSIKYLYSGRHRQKINIKDECVNTVQVSHHFERELYKERVVKCLVLCYEQTLSAITNTLLTLSVPRPFWYLPLLSLWASSFFTQ